MLVYNNNVLNSNMNTKISLIRTLYRLNKKLMISSLLEWIFEFFFFAFVN